MKRFRIRRFKKKRFKTKINNSTRMNADLADERRSFDNLIGCGNDFLETPHPETPFLEMP